MMLKRNQNWKNDTFFFWIHCIIASFPMESVFYANLWYQQHFVQLHVTKLGRIHSSTAAIWLQTLFGGKVLTEQSGSLGGDFSITYHCKGRISQIFVESWKTERKSFDLLPIELEQLSASTSKHVNCFLDIWNQVEQKFAEVFQTKATGFARACGLVCLRMKKKNDDSSWLIHSHLFLKNFRMICYSDTYASTAALNAFICPT